MTASAGNSPSVTLRFRLAPWRQISSAAVVPGFEAATFVHLQFGGTTQGHRRQSGGFDFQQCHIGAAIGADYSGLEFALFVCHAHRNFVGIRDHVRIGKNVAVLADDKTGSQSLTTKVRTTVLRGIGHEPAEEFVEWVAGIASWWPGYSGRSRRNHVDDSRPLFLHQHGKVG